jgi:hypothetical protein
MIMTNKLLPVALIAALVGGSVGALVMHSKNQPATSAETLSQDKAVATQDQTGGDQFVPAGFNTSTEQSAYKVGFADGFRAADSGAAGVNSLAPAAVVNQPSRVVYRNPSRRTARSSSSQPVYYSRQQPQKRSFWQKHRDKLTVAIGAGSGAAVGGLIGGKKGAAIGALAGGGGSALYTYKLRNRNRRY